VERGEWTPGGWRARVRREDGGALVEYALLVAPLALGLIVAIVFLRAGIAHTLRSGGQSTAAYRAPSVQGCDPNYSGACVPPYPPAADYSDLLALGITQVTVTGSDPDNLDPDGDGIGCN